MLCYFKPIAISFLCYSHSLLHILYFEIEMLVERVYVDLGAAGVNSNAHPFVCENLLTIAHSAISKTSQT